MILLNTAIRKSNLKTIKTKELRFFDSLKTAIEVLSSSSMYKNFTNKKYNMYQIPRGELIGAVYIPSKSHKGKSLTFTDKDDNELSINASVERENAIWEIILGMDKDYSTLSDLEISKITFWFIMGGGNKDEALCEVDMAKPFMVLLGVNWDGKWIYNDKHRSKKMRPETIHSINKQRIFYLDQFEGKPDSFMLDYPALAQDAIRCNFIHDKIINKVSGSEIQSRGVYAVICIPEAPYFFQRPDEFWFGITNNSTSFNKHGNSNSSGKIQEQKI